MPDKPIYLDYNATTPIDREAADAMLPYLYEHFGNPSSGHELGWVAREAVDDAREQIASLLNASPSEMIFTSGGTEANNMVLKGVAEAYAGQGKHIIISAIEHPAVTEPCDVLVERGFKITKLPVDEFGLVDLEALEHALTPETILVSVMLANNEVGTIQPVQTIAEMAHAHGALVHTDAAQAVGKIPVDVRQLGVDFLSVAGHKLYAPKGIGALFVRDGVSLPKFMHGAAHESNRRAGTESVLLMVGLGKAAEVAQRDMVKNSSTMQATRDRLYAKLTQRLDSIRRNGRSGGSLPNTLSLSILGVEANVLVAVLSQTVAVSAGAACHAHEVSISTTLQALQIPVEYAKGTVRFSTGKQTTEAEIDIASNLVSDAVQKLRS